MNTYPHKFLLFALAVCSVPATAIVIRHDVDDSAYQEFVSSYSASVAYTEYCAFTVLSPDWLLTAAHCMTGGGREPFDIVHLGGRYRVNRVSIHSEFDSANDELNDVAVVQLRDPLIGAIPAWLFQSADEQGEQVVFVGRGATGNGEVGLLRHDERERAATNTVLEATSQHLVFRFDPPATATELEGISGPADSGGPAFIERDGMRYVAGISGFQDRAGFEQAHYNVMEYYSRVSVHSDWIQATIGSTPPVAAITHPLISAMQADDDQQFTEELNALGSAALEESVITELYYQAVHLDRVDMASQLLDAGIPFLSVRYNDASLFEFALVRDRAALFDRLLEATEGMTGIHADTSRVFPLMVRRFRREAGVEARARELYAQGANLNAQLENGDTALISTGWATNNVPFIRWLVENGADINMSNNSGDTPLMDSARLGKIDIMNYLLSQNADTTLMNDGGMTALDIARARGRDEMVEILSAR
jgi:ankyrin repeat protein